jgi:2'-5' RNA ligase
MTKTTETYRCFIALPLPEQVKGALVNAQEQLRRQLPKDTWRWSKPEQLHLTLDFLGDVPMEKVEAIAAHLDWACRGIAPFELHLGALGSFGRPPRVLWASVEGDLEALHKLQGQVALSKDAKPFHSHLTLARARGQASFSAVRLEAVHWQLGEVCLFRSELHPQGASHTVLHRVKLLLKP